MADDLAETRRLIQPLLSPTNPADALASYYALWHDPRRTRLVLHTNVMGRPDGFLAVCQTGADLFRPLVTLRAPSDLAVGELLQASLAPQRPFLVTVPLGLAPSVQSRLEISHSSVNRLYRLDPERFRPVINVLVQRVTSADGTSRFQIESQGQLVAMSGTNWQSPSFAEVFVYVHPAARGRGWGRSVVSACTGALLEARRQPLYMVQERNLASLHIAEALGYMDTGVQEFTAEGQRPG